MNYESNTSPNTEAKSFIADVHEYSDFEERSLNKKACILLEQQEQERRLADVNGELIRRQNAKLASGFIHDSSKIINQVPAFAIVVKEAMWNAGSNISAAASSATANTAELSTKGWETVRAKVSEASSKVQDVNLTEPLIDARIAFVNTAIHASQLAVDVGSNISAAATSTAELSAKGWETVRAKVSEAGAKVQDVHLSEPVIDARIAFVNTAIHATQLAVDVGRKGSELTREVSRKGSELSLLGEEKYYQVTKKISDTSSLVAISFERFVKFGDVAYDLVSDVLKRITKRFSGWIQHTWEQAIYSANLSYSVHLAEKERKRRLTSEDESHAILNALAVSSLVKELAPELYRPAEEPSRTYAFALLEEKEQQHRIAQEKLGENLSGKAHYIANMVKAHHEAAPTKELLPVFTAEQIILPDPMQIFEEPRNLTEELAMVKPIQKLQEPAISGSPQPLRAAM